MTAAMKGVVSLAYQSSLGHQISDFTTGSATNIYADAFNFDLVQNRYDYKNIVNSQGAPDDKAGTQLVNLTISGPAYNDTLMWLFSSFVGGGAGNANWITTSRSGPIYDHIFYVGAPFNDYSSVSPCTPLSVVFSPVAGNEFAASGCVVTNIELSLAPNAPLRFSANLIGAVRTNLSYTRNTTYQMSLNTLVDFSHIYAESIGLFGGTLEGYSIRMSNGMEAIYGFNTIAPLKFARSDFYQVEGSITETLTKSSMDAFAAQTQTSLGVLSLRSAVSSYNVIMHHNQGVITTYPVGVNGRGRVVVDGAFKLFYGVGAAGSNSNFHMLMATSTNPLNSIT